MGKFHEASCRSILGKECRVILIYKLWFKLPISYHSVSCVCYAIRYILKNYQKLGVQYETILPSRKS